MAENLGTITSAPESVEAQTSYTIDEAVERRSARREQERAEQEAAQAEIDTDQQDSDATIDVADEQETNISEGVETPEDAAEPEEVNGGDETDGGEADEDIPSIDPPTFYTADQKAQFATLDPVSQASIVQLTKQGEAYVTQSVHKHRAESRAQVKTKLEQFDQAIEIAKSLGAKKFATDAELGQLMNAGQLSADDAVKHQLERQAYQEEVSSLEKARQEERQSFIAQNIKERTEALQVTNQRVLDDAKDVVSFASRRGYTAESIDQADAVDLEILWMATQWEKSQSAAQKSVKRARKKPVKVIKPARGNASANPQSAELKRLKAAADTGDIDAMLAYRKAARRSAR